MTFKCDINDDCDYLIIRLDNKALTMFIKDDNLILDNDLGVAFCRKHYSQITDTGYSTYD